MKMFFLLSKMDKMFEFSSTMSIVIFIISALFSIAILGGIIYAIVKTIKGVKNGTIKLEDVDEKDDPNFTSCEYCGAENKKENTSCEKCGAGIKH